MISEWKAVLISSVSLLAFLVAPSAARDIRETTFTGIDALEAGGIRGGSCLRRGAAYSDSLLDRELVRVDSLYFSYGFLETRFTVDTVHVGDGVDVTVEITEGPRASIGMVSVSGSELIDHAEITRNPGLREGEFFDARELERSLERLLSAYVNAGYPYAQIWLVGFDYREVDKEIDLSLSIVAGGEAVIADVIFEGLTKTDTTLALRTARLKRGVTYREEDIRLAADYLTKAGYLASVGEPSVERQDENSVDIVIPVTEIERGNMFQGALGVSRKQDGDYILNGSLYFELRNIAGSGRDIKFNWLNDGERYSIIDLRYTEPFIFSLPAHLDAEIKQEIQDTLYTWHSGGLYLRFPLGPSFSLLAGVAVDRNIPGVGYLERSTRQRYRLGFAKETKTFWFVSGHIDGAYKRSSYEGGLSETEGQMLYRFESILNVPVFKKQAIYFRLVSEAVFASNPIPAAEMYSLGGATTLRGYRENQFRGERVAYTNLEYRFGAGGWLFLFDDTGAFYREGAGWIVKNGVGFGLRSASPIGTVALSFGVGESLSLEGTRIHIALIERF